MKYVPHAVLCFLIAVIQMCLIVGPYHTAGALFCAVVCLVLGGAGLSEDRAMAIGICIILGAITGGASGLFFETFIRGWS